MRLAQGDENFKELNSEEIKNPKPGEVVYADDKEILCRRWNWRECDKTKMTEATKNVALVVEGLPPMAREKVGEIVEELGNLVKNYCKGKVSTYLLDRNNPIANI